ncbi:myo-inositol 2-dehydrogenase [Actibacterium mucosum KCTC 23349]|uniref:Myo-inositol 2-dehydrogenase n=1 Tax=Actibacterium mucosum KCTC 23349 TaxID=1454373 RepID=A0A037ZL73_9RHOB|nr:Gfo/Idh/MocA family oxidoreductase [Actibacterium mucosum]KAJ57201.1 myo-inositol 2-dehydrogenase [Actibacterium mucosum KCTC 23349]
MGNLLNVGLIGTGFMGKTHALAWRNVKAVMGVGQEISLHTLCDMPEEKARATAVQFGFANATADWRAMISDPAIDVVSITTPNQMHRDMALAAIEAGKHVWCEKPMALTLDEARMMEAAAKARGVTTMVGYNYIHNPAFRHAQRLIADDVIGRVVHFRGWVDEDYQADPDLPWTWRARIADAGLGTLGDLGCHLISMAYGLCGPIDSLVADMQTVHETRPLPDGTGRGAVENEDTATALVRFANGVHGSVASSRSAWGRKNKLAWEVHGTKGMICFEQERMNELQLYTNEGPKAQQGFRTILTGPEHAPFGNFCPAPGHQLGFGDLKIIEAAALLDGIASGTPPYPDFTAALEFEKVIHAMAQSARDGRRVFLQEV